MKYYRARKEDDQRPRYRQIKGHAGHVERIGIYIANAFTSKKAASGAAKFYHADGAKVVRLEKHVKEGPTTVAKHTILELTND